MRNLSMTFLVSLILLLVLGLNPVSAPVQAGGDSQPFATVNRHRVAKGLPAFQSNVTPESTPVPDGGDPPPIVTATERPDGSIVHEVQAGEALIAIAQAYDLPLFDLLELNGLRETDVIYPGDELIIQVAFTPTPTVTLTATATAPRPTRRPPPTATLIPRASLTPLAVSAAQEGSSDSGAANAEFLDELEMDSERRPVILVVVAGAFIILMVPFLLALKRKFF